jgi:hypothetical protein
MFSRPPRIARRPNLEVAEKRDLFDGGDRGTVEKHEEQLMR